MTSRTRRARAFARSTPRMLSAVILGGAIGTLLRIEILRFTAAPSFTALDNQILLQENWWRLVPWTLVLINTFGVFAATCFLASRWAPEPDNPRRLFVITGLLGGLTSYSSLIASIAVINRVSTVGALVTTLGALGLGLVAAWIGAKVARRC